MIRSKHVLSLLVIFLLFSGVVDAQIVERNIEATEYIQTNDEFIYQTVHIPVLDITYHEFSSDSLTWRKDFQEGDCYVRFANTTTNTTNPYTSKQGYHDDWWVFNFCGTGGGSGNIDTVIVCDGSVCDTITAGTVSIQLYDPNTITGTTLNTKDGTSHTHELVLYIGELQDVDSTAKQDGIFLKWNEVLGKHVYSPDLTGGGGELRVRTQDLATDVNNVTEIRVENGVLTDEGAGAVSIDFTLEPIDGEQDFFRTDTVLVNAGDTFLTFSDPLPANDYVVVNAYALYSNGERQSLSYDSTAVDGFRVLSVLEASEVHYLVMRNLDSLGIVVDGIGRVYASGTDATLGYLNQKVDNNTIAVVDDELAFIADTISVDLVTTDDMVLNGDSLRATTQMTNADTIVATSAWVLNNIGAGQGWDSITKSTDEEYYIWWYGGAKLDSVQRTGIFLEIADSTAYVTPTYLDSVVNGTTGLKQMIYKITLPTASSIGDRIALAVEGTDYPTGWVLTALNTVDLKVEHNLSRRCAGASVDYLVSGTINRALINSTAYTGRYSPDENSVVIESLALGVSAELYVYITLE